MKRVTGLVACISCRRVETPYMLRINHGMDSILAAMLGHCLWRSGERDLFGHLIDPDPHGLVARSAPRRIGL